MKKFAILSTAVCLAILVTLSFYGCNVTGSNGTIHLSLINQMAAKTLLPDISMVVETYFVQLTGPNGELIEEEVGSTVTTLTYPGLAFGDWTVTVKGKNDAGFIIGKGLLLQGLFQIRSRNG